MAEVSLKPRILLAEEEGTERLMIREYLEIMGSFEVLEVQGLYPLLELCENPLSRISLVLLDTEWSRVDGADLILEIRRRNRLLPILGMTDRRVDLYNDSRFRGSLVGFIPKPFSPYHLSRCIKAVLRAHAEATFPPPLRVGKGLFRIGSSKGRALPARARD